MGEGAATFRGPTDAYARHVGRYGRALAEALVERAGIGPGAAVLDVGCGPGTVTEVLVERVGADRVAAVDPSESFVATCRARFPDVRVELGAAEELPFAVASFDAALAQLVVNFMDDAPAGVSEMRRVTRPGGTVAAAVWDYAGEMTMLRAFWDGALDVDPDGAPARDEGRTMRFCQPEELHALWEEAGLAEPEVGEIVVAADYADFDDYWWPFTQGFAPSGAYYASLGAELQEALRLAVRARLGSPDGPFRLTARAWWATGRA